MGHNVERSILAGKLSKVMNMPLPTLTTRSYRRGWESSVIRAYSNMINNLKTLKVKLGLGDVISEDPMSNKKTYDALSSAVGGWENTTIQQLEANIAHDTDEIIRLGTISGGTNDIISPLVTSKIPILNISLARNIEYLNLYNSGVIFVNVNKIVSTIQKSNELKRMIEMEKHRILYEDEGSEEAQQLAVDTIATNSIADYEANVTLRNQTIEEYNIWSIAEEKRKKEKFELLEKERLEFIGTEDITIPTTEPTVIPHNPEESEFIDEVPEGYHKMPDGTIMKGSEHKTEREKLVEKTGISILVIGAIGLYLALRFKS
jgi:hypothetical protein